MRADNSSDSTRSMVALDDRGVLAVTGEDRVTFLQGLVTNDVTKASESRAIHAALLTAQGRFLHEFFIVASGDALLLEGEAARLDDLMRRLKLYKLRARVAIENRSERFRVIALIGTGIAAALDLAEERGAAREFGEGAIFVDPRHLRLGVRAIVTRSASSTFIARGFVEAPRRDYDRIRLPLGVPDGSRDLPVEHALPMENNFDEMQSIDWKKGCYIGQELTARMKYRALVKKRLVPVRIEGAAPPPGTTVTLAGDEAGEMRSAAGEVGLALLRIQKLEEAEGRSAFLDAAGAHLHPLQSTSRPAER
jgi:folate-binding protein YgfZ